MYVRNAPSHISKVKMLLPTGNIQKGYKVCCLDDRLKSRHFFKLGAFRKVKLIMFFHSEAEKNINHKD